MSREIKKGSKVKYEGKLWRVIKVTDKEVHLKNLEKKEKDDVSTLIINIEEIK